MSLSEFIREQPAALDRCIEAGRAFARSWPVPGFSGVALVGSGSSFNALTVARPRFVAARRGTVLVYEPEDFIAELPDRVRTPVVVVLSQSGASRTSIAAVEAAVAADLPVLAITASPNTALAVPGARVLEMPVGAEPVGPKTKGFVGSLAMLFGLAEALGAPAAPTYSGAAFAPLIDGARVAAAALAAELGDVDALIFAGRRAAYGVALESSLKVAEVAGIPTAAFPTEEFLHGRVHGMTARTVAFLFAETAQEAGEALSVQAALKKRGCRVIVVDAAGAHWPRLPLAPTPWSALGLILPFQWLAIFLAEARGLVPEQMRYGRLIDELSIKTDRGP